METYAKCKNCAKDCDSDNLLLMQKDKWIHIQGEEEECSDACFGCLCENPKPLRETIKNYSSKFKPKEASSK